MLRAGLVCVFIFLMNTDGMAQRLRLYIAPDGKKEAYYAAGDRFLTVAFELMDTYWTRIATRGLNQVRGHLDNYLPIELKAMRHKPAEAMMRLFAEAFFAARDPETGLIPGSGSRWSSVFLVNMRNKQPVYLVAKAADLMEWFPEDRDLLQKFISLAEATMKYFDYEYSGGRKAGMWGYVDVEGGEARGPITLTLWFGAMAKGMAWLTKATGDPRFLAWADQKMEFVWQMRLNKDLPILCDVFIPYSAVMNDGWTSDTDTLYYVRMLYEIYKLTGNAKYRTWAMAVTDFWLERAWNEQWGHFVRKLRHDGTPAVDRLYGDAKYNFLHILVNAYLMTKDRKYLDRLKLAWRNYLRIGPDGLVAECMERGKMDQRYGPDPQQTIFMEILLDAYNASGDQEFLREAEALAQRVLRAGPKVMRMEGCQAGNAFLRTALARRPIRRLEVPLQPEARLAIACYDQMLLDISVPANIAVLYLPAGNYDLTVGKRKVRVALDSDKHVE